MLSSYHIHIWCISKWEHLLYGSITYRKQKETDLHTYKESNSKIYLILHKILLLLPKIIILIFSV